MKKELQYGSKRISYNLEYSKRKTLGITVTPDMEVLVKAPEGSLQECIEEKLEKRAQWILKQQSHFLRFYPKMPEKQYRGGETHLYLGRQYRLRVATAKKNAVHFTGREIHVFHTPRNSAKSVLINWYRHRAKLKFAEIAEPWIQRFEQYGVQPEGLFIQEMRTRWGSCTTNGKIILNPELIKAPKPCIEYVIIHELCHLIHRHHTQRFFQLQSTIIPDWEKWKNKLESMMI
ncbi:SprT family zinc-dependent metalloprotease [Flavitalea sp. BT771]|uniref:M48 family metallopeptidase n=1 Tax=Flavitalea sp. BT771 TaxID=3063329 RepID=UPI0026E46EB7|nr:SprT family zinc-dependent metalloprotease [Flavitalea sp. BT771]MDO6435636.1 SprT family zinc-dependent metalloprotease [Flavitalea sp. BT771]MDV6224537.1 SprT family zinc-dependent metalloprotease [Flavitalea sp. BT771]